jgi:hypothetical protein
VAVEPASFDAGAVCANACGDVWAATATANAAINMLMDFRIDAPFLFFVVPPGPLRERRNAIGAHKSLDK